MTVHQCDFCKKIVEDYTAYVLPVNKYVYIEREGKKVGRNKEGIASQKIDLCAKCQQILADFYDAYLND